MDYADSVNLDDIQEEGFDDFTDEGVQEASRPVQRRSKTERLRVRRALEDYFEKKRVKECTSDLDEDEWLDDIQFI